jgi:hypothetical protein
MKQTARAYSSPVLARKLNGGNNIIRNDERG